MKATTKVSPSVAKPNGNLRGIASSFKLGCPFWPTDSIIRKMYVNETESIYLR